jgi:hypothetical protein
MVAVTPDRPFGSHARIPRRRGFVGSGLRIVAIAVAAMVAPSCDLDTGFGTSTSHAEQVDAEVEVDVRLAEGRKVTCRKELCRIHFTAAVTTDSVDGIWARNCSLIVRDSEGNVLTTTPMEFGFPAGIFTRAGMESHSDGNAEVVIPRRAQDRIDGLDAWCRAYVWHGEPPI